MGKGAKNRKTARRTESEKDAGKIDGQPVSPRFLLAFPSSRLSPLSEPLEQAVVHYQVLLIDINDITE